MKQGTFDFSNLEDLMHRETWETTTHLRGPKRSAAGKKKK